MARPQPIVIPGPSGMGGNFSSSNFELIPKEVGIALLSEFLNSRRQEQAQAGQEQSLNNMFQALSRTELAQPGTGEQMGPTAQAATQANQRFNMPEMKAIAQADPQGVIDALINFAKPLNPKEQADLAKTQQEVQYNQAVSPLNIENKQLSNAQLLQQIQTAGQGYKQRERQVGPNGDRSVFETSFDKGKTWSQIGEAYPTPQAQSGKAYTPLKGWLPDPNDPTGNNLLPIWSDERNAKLLTRDPDTNALVEYKGTGKSLLPVQIKPLPTAVQDDLSQQINLMDSLNTLEKYNYVSGLGEGFIREQNMKRLGIGEQEVADAMAAQKSMKVSLQSMIKGIPSNFDVQTFAAAMWDINNSEKLNKSLLAKNKKDVTALFRNSIAYYKNTGTAIPQELYEQAEGVGLNIDNIKPWDGKGDPLLHGELSKFGKDNKKDKGGFIDLGGGYSYTVVGE